MGEGKGPMIYLRLSIAFALGLLIMSCAPAYKNLLERPTRSGYVPEVDEASTRGKLVLVSPTNLDIAWRYTLSPDGKSVVVSARTAESDDPFQLYRVDLGGGAPVKLTSGLDSLDAWDPSFTADGKHIVYRAGNSFWKISRDGSGARVKVPGSGLGSDFYPQVSKQDKLAFVTFDFASRKYLIWTSRIDGGELTQFREGNFPNWSPDGEKIVFEYKGDIWMMSSNGTELTQLTSTKDIVEGLPSFSNDGEYVLFASDESRASKKGGDVNIWYVNADGTGKTQRTELRSWDSWPAMTDQGVYFLSGRGKGNYEVTKMWLIKN